MIADVQVTIGVESFAKYEVEEVLIEDAEVAKFVEAYVTKVAVEDGVGVLLGGMVEDLCEAVRVAMKSVVGRGVI